MPKVIKKCKFCGKQEVEKSHKVIGRDRHVNLECGHLKIEKALSVTPTGTVITSDSGKIPYPFQFENLQGIEEFSNGRALIADEMGLGKTISALITVQRHSKEMFPVLAIVKSSLVRQWEMEATDWLDEYVHRVSNAKDMVPIGFKFYVVSYDLLPRFKDLSVFDHIRTVILDECQQIKNSDAKRTESVRRLVSGSYSVKRGLANDIGKPRIEMIARDLMSYHGISDRFTLHFESIGSNKLGLCECAATDGIIKGRIILDKEHCFNSPESDIIETILHEIAHAITPGAGHRPIWSDTCKQIGGNGEQFASCDGTVTFTEQKDEKKYLLALSGTPIKNSGWEYFPILNMLRPEMFPNANSYGERYLTKVYNGPSSFKYGGLRPDAEPEFRAKTESFIFRHTREEVLPDLPKVRRLTRFSDLGKKVEEAYAKMFEGFLEEYEKQEDKDQAKKFQRQANILGFLNKMRHLTGLSKVDPCVDFVEEFLSETDRPITIFVHHKDVAELMMFHLRDHSPLNINSSLDSNARQQVIDDFRNKKSRVLIASALAAGEGLNIQFCSDCVMLERQWNPANEEQCEGRFTRIGSKASVVDATYFVATGTIDEFFATLVEEKRMYVKGTLDGTEGTPAWNESSIMKELADTLAREGKNKWKLSN